MLKQAGKPPLTSPPGEGHLRPSERSAKGQLLYELNHQLRTKTKTAEELLQQLYRDDLPNLTVPVYGARIHYSYSRARRVGARTHENAYARRR